MSKQLSLTVGITTCFGDESILDTVRSVRSSAGMTDFRFIIVADRVPISPAIKKELDRYQVELIENTAESSQTSKRKQILARTTSDIILFTQDDVLFEKTALATIMNRFTDHPDTTFISIKNEPVHGESFFEDVASVGTALTNRIAATWNNGDNYLSVVGRCMAFRTTFITQQFILPDEIVSSDAYHYFEHKRRGGAYEFIPHAVLYFRNPQTLKEYVRKSSRFQFSQVEMSQYFKDLKKEYRIPPWLIATSFLKEFLHDPVKMTAYIGLYLYSRLQKKDKSDVLNPVWEVDISTKKVLAQR